MLAQIDQAASKALEMPTRVGSNPTWVREDLRGLEYTTSLGLLHYALTGQGQSDKPKQHHAKRLLNKVVKLFSN